MVATSPWWLSVQVGWVGSLPMLAHSSCLGSEKMLLLCCLIFAVPYVWTRLRISSAAGGVPLLMGGHPAGPSASLLALGGGHNAGEDGFLVALVARAVCRAASIVEGARLAGFGMLVCSHYAGVSIF